MSGLSSSQPYPGLRAFEEGDQEYFFGRDAQTRGLRQKIDSSRLVAVVGRSGCGKSSLVKAGLIPMLAQENAAGEPIWRIALFRPQGRPMEELGTALLDLAPGGAEDARELRRSRLAAMLSRSSQGLVEAARELGLSSSGRLLIIVDQFEEIFRFEDPSGTSADEATAFVRLLIEAINAETPHINVILTMRLDFLGDCARFQRLPEAISDGQYLVPNLSRAERRAAIEAPAKKAGKLIRPEVTQRLLNEIGEDPDQLPVLQHVLMRMWQHAGAAAEISLDDYTGTGGVQEAISRHADQIYGALPSDGHRIAAERLFKAISERDRRGRSIRRATQFGDIAAIVSGDDAMMPAAKSEQKLLEVVEAFRAPDCCFVMPPAGEFIEPSTLIDISHESLLRGWSRLTGTPEKEGWIGEEAANGRKYNDLLEDEKRNYIFPSKIADERQQWWRTTQPNEAWAARYGSKFAAVRDFLEGVCNLHRREFEIRQQRAVRKRYFGAAGAVLALIGVILVVAFFFNEQAKRAQLAVQQAELAKERVAIETERARVATAGEEQIAQEKNRLARESEAKLNQALADIQAQKDQLERFRQDVSERVEQVQKALPLNDSKIQQDLSKFVQSNSVVNDATAQRAIVDGKGDAPTATLSSNNGFMWIGSIGASPRSNLNTPAGVAVAADAVKAGDQYTTDLDIYLRKGLPELPGYIQQPTLGIMPEGTRIQIVNIAPPFQRPTGDQLWAQVRVVKLALSTVYFQFAGGARDQARQLSKTLQEKGYKIPGEDRTGAAAGKHEVRYFYAAQKAIGIQLAADATQALQRLGYPSLQVAAVLAGEPAKSNPDGKLELWLEIPSK